MAGTVRNLGYVRGSNGPDLARVEANEQIVSHIGPNSPSSGNSPAQKLIAYAVGGYVGNWFSPAVIRYGVYSASSSSAAPGSLLAQTVDISPSVNYVDAAGGQYREAPLDSPLLIDTSDTVAIGIRSRNNAAGVAMYQASDISQPNESFYRKGVSGSGMQHNSNSSASNEGQLALRIIGEYNVAPTAPTNTTPASGASETTLTPNIRGDFNDANKTLNDGRAWDYAQQTEIFFRQGADVIWNPTYTTTSSERSNHRTVRRYAGPALQYYTTYNYYLRHRDRAGEWGAISTPVYFTIRHNNRPPNAPKNFSGLGTRNGTRNITVGADFTDPDYPLLPNGQSYERFESKQIIVRRASDNAIVYNSGIIPTTSTERSNARSSTSYTLPSWDVTYRWYERHFDRSGEASAYASATVIARSGGSMDTPTSPSGRVTNLSNPGSVSARYQNTGSVNATTIQFTLSRPGLGHNLSVATFTSLNVTPGTLFTRTWAACFSDVTLGHGVEYEVRARAHVPGPGWTDYSDPITFTTNARPNTPTLWGPQDGGVANYVYTTSVRASDDDSDDGTLTVTAEYYADADMNTLLGTRTLPYRPGVGGSIQNVYGRTSDDLITSHGTYYWRAKANDGYVDSDWSPLWSFTYAAVPNVTVIAPAGPVVGTMQPMFVWISSGQNRYRVRGYSLDNELVYDTGEVTSSNPYHIISADQHWIGGERWNNGETFIWEVGVRDGTGLWGWSSQLELTLEYTPPEPLTVEIEAMSLPGVEGTHYALATISEPDTSDGDFIRTIVDRVEIDGPAGNEIPGTLVENRFIAGSPGVTEFADFDVTSHQWYRWSFRHEVQVGIDVIESDPVYAEMMVSFHGTLLHMPFNPLEQYVWLQYGAPGAQYEPRRRKSRRSGGVHPIHSALPLGYSGRHQSIEIDGEYTLLERGDMSASQQYNVLDRMFDYQDHDKSPDGRPHGMCWREGRGGRNGRIYVELIEFEDVPYYQESQVVTLAFEARTHRLGEG